MTDLRERTKEEKTKMNKKTMLTGDGVCVKVKLQQSNRPFPKHLVESKARHGGYFSYDRPRERNFH